MIKLTKKETEALEAMRKSREAMNSLTKLVADMRTNPEMSKALDALLERARQKQKGSPFTAKIKR